MTNAIREIGDAACILAIGTNTTEAHPIVALEVVRAVRKGARLIVANPLRIDLARHASIVLRHRPGSDTALLMGMARVILEEGLEDREFMAARCENFEAFKASLDAFSMDFVTCTTGLAAADIRAAARMYASTKPGSILYAMGITQHSHGTDNVKAVANLAMLTGNLGKPSSGVNPLRGQNNVQGSCDMGCLPDVLPGYQKVTDPAARGKFENAWGVKLPEKPGVTYTEIFDRVLEGKITALYQVGENPVLSDANSGHTIEALKKLDFYVVQDIFLNESAKFAHVVLPAACFAEKDGSFTNTERRVQRVRAAVPPPGEARADWWITCAIARRMGGRGFEYEGPEAIMREIAQLTPSYGGIAYPRIEACGLQWPCPDATHPGTPYLHRDTFRTPSGRGVFQPLAYRPPAEVADAEYPLILTTDRSLYHYHTATMTRRVKGLNAMRDRELVMIHPDDAGSLGITTGDRVRVTSRRGAVTADASVTEDALPGVIAMTFHFAETPTNMITSPALDPDSKIPETKVAAVRVEKA